MVGYRTEAGQPVVRTHSDLKNINLAISDVLKQRADDWVIGGATVEQNIDSMYPTVELSLKFFNTTAAMEFFSALNGLEQCMPIAVASAVPNDNPAEIDNFSSVD